MPLSPRPRRLIVAAVAAATGLAFTLSACEPERAPASAATPTPRTDSGLPDAHVHGLSVNANTGQLLLATHSGLYDVTNLPTAKIGPTQDLMGFTAGGSPELLYGSGHPGPGTGDSDPLGLITSADGGKTWLPLSRQGESDFHALTATKTGIVGFDGRVQVSPDGKSWTSVSVDFQPAALAGHPDSDTVLATAQDGLRRSGDGGATWSKVASAPVIQFAAFASDRIAVGVTPDGTAYRSDDGGATWTAKGKLAGPAHAIAASQSSDNIVRIWVATGQGLEVSNDGGLTFSPHSPGNGPRTRSSGEQR